MRIAGARIERSDQALARTQRPLSAPERAGLAQRDTITNVGKTMGRQSVLQRVQNIARSSWNHFLWKQLKPSTFSSTGLPIAISSLSDWDVFSEIWVSHEYDEPVERALAAARPGQPVRIVDLGANVGLFSLRCIELRNRFHPQQLLEIVAVEGVPRTFQILTQNLASQRNATTSIALHQGLVGERSGSGQIYDNAYAGANTIVPADGKTSTLSFRGAHAVAGAYLDLESILPPGVEIDLLKCDIEGSEAVFLCNYPALLSRVRYVAIEIHPLHCDVDECRKMLAEAGLERDRALRSSATMILETYRNRAET